MLQVALESVSATHQLVSAIHTFAICVRPLLLTGFAPNPDSAESGPVDAAEHKVCGRWTSVSGSWYRVHTPLFTPLHCNRHCNRQLKLAHEKANKQERQQEACSSRLRMPVLLVL
jgi:hypothetical protein